MYSLQSVIDKKTIKPINPDNKIKTGYENPSKYTHATTLRVEVLG